MLERIAAVNQGHTFSYGHDGYDQRVAERVQDLFGAAEPALFVWGGSGANVLCLRTLCRPWHGVLCAQTAHINVDECGAPEAMGAIKLLPAPTPDGKLTTEILQRLIARVGDEHAIQPGVVSITQPTERGTLYEVAEVRAIASLAHEHGLRVHMDGARLSNAAAALGTTLRAVTTDAGVDIISFGGTKNGLLGAEAVVVLSEGIADGIEYLRKQTMQLASKMRFLSAQFDALLADDLWLRNARNANAMAARLAAAVDGAPGLEFTEAVQCNTVFATLPARARSALLQRFAFYPWDESIGEVRWMCSWDTTADDVDALAAAVWDVCD